MFSTETEFHLGNNFLTEQGASMPVTLPACSNHSSQLGLAFREPSGGDQVIVFPYASGMSRRRDMAAAIESLAGVGAEIGELSGPGIEQLAQAIADGKPAFVDSGAFNAFKAAMRAGKPEEARLDFEPIFGRYDEISMWVCGLAPYAHRSLLMLVAPDVVGDQLATLELIEANRHRIMGWIEAGHEVIVPFQSGPIGQFEAYLRVREALEDLPFVVGIPSAARAMSDAELRDLLGQVYRPDRLHILGAISSKRMDQRMEVIRECYVDDVPGVTADANVMRSKLGEIAGLAGAAKFEQIKSILNRVVPAAMGGGKALH